MSIYSGLPTRKDEHNYNKLLSKLFLTLQQHVLQLSKGFIDTKYIVQYSKVLAKLKELQEHKYLPPKYSQLFDPLLEAGKGQTPKNFNASINSQLQSVKEQQQLPSHRYLGKIQQISKKKSSLSKIHLKNRISAENLSAQSNQRSSSVFSDKNKPKSDLEWRKTVHQMDLKQNGIRKNKTFYRAKKKALNVVQVKNPSLIRPNQSYVMKRKMVSQSDI